MALGAFGQMLWADIERGVSIAQFAAQGGDDAPDTNPEDVEDTHAAMRAIAIRLRVKKRTTGAVLGLVSRL